MENKHSLIYQNSVGVLPVIRRLGCFWRVGIHIAEEIAEKRVQSAQELNDLWVESVHEGMLLDRGTGPELHKGLRPVVLQGLKHFDVNRNIAEIAIKREDEIVEYGWYKNRGDAYHSDRRFYVQKVKLDPDEHIEPYHYRQVNENDEVIFDPYQPSLSHIGVVYTIIFEEIL